MSYQKYTYAACALPGNTFEKYKQVEVVNTYCAIIFRQYLSPLCSIWELDHMWYGTSALLTWTSSLGFLDFAPSLRLMCDNVVWNICFSMTRPQPVQVCFARVDHISCGVMCDTHFANLRCTTFTWAVCVVALLQCISNRVRSKVNFPIYLSYYCNDIFTCSINHGLPLSRPNVVWW